jgi:hypothetical protein
MNLVPINTNTNTNTNPFENISSNENYSETEYFFHSNNINESQENIAINEIEIKLQNNIIDNNHIIDFSNEFVQKLYNDFLMEINDTYNNEDSCIICLDVFDKNNIMFDNVHNITVKKDCSCNYFVHITCLNEWLKESEKCLICPKPIDTLYNMLSKQTGNIDIDDDYIDENMNEPNNFLRNIVSHVKTVMTFIFYILFILFILYIIIG